MTGLRPLTGTGPELDGVDLVRRLGEAAGVRANMVASVDGRATIEGRVGGLTGAADQLLLGALRAWCDVLLVGAGTVRAEGYGVVDLPPAVRELRIARGQAPLPVLAILSGSLDLDPGLPALAEPGPQQRPWVLTSRAAPADRRRRLQPSAHLVDLDPGPDGEVSPGGAVDALRGAGFSRVLSEGGPKVLGELVREGMLDEVFVTVSPLLVGGGGPGILDTLSYDPPVALELLEVLGGAGEVFLRYRVGSTAAAEGSGGAERA